MSYELGCITDQIQVLHPCHKLAYFRKLKWPLDWINLAETLVRDEFERNYTAIFDNVEDEEDDNDNEASPKPKVSHSAPVCYFFIDNPILEEGECFQQPTGTSATQTKRLRVRTGPLLEQRCGECNGRLSMVVREACYVSSAIENGSRLSFDTG